MSSIWNDDESAEPIDPFDDRKPAAKPTPVDADTEPRSTSHSAAAAAAAAGEAIPEFDPFASPLLSGAVQEDREPLLSSDEVGVTYREMLDKRRPSRADKPRRADLTAAVVAIDAEAYEIARAAAAVEAAEGMKRKADHSAELVQRAAEKLEGWTRLNIPSGWLEEDSVARIELLIVRERERAARASCRPYWGVGGGRQWLSFNEQLALMYPPIWTLTTSRAGAVTASALEQVLRVRRIARARANLPQL